METWSTQYEKVYKCMSVYVGFQVFNSYTDALISLQTIQGVRQLYANLGSSDTRAVGTYFYALERNKDYYKVKGFSFDIVKIIYQWTNLYIHCGYRPEPWRPETAIEYLKTSFSAGQALGDKNSYSLYAGIEVYETDLEDLRKRTKESVETKSGDRIVIKWILNPEVMIIKEK